MHSTLNITVKSSSLAYILLIWVLKKDFLKNKNMVLRTYLSIILL